MKLVIRHAGEAALAAFIFLSAMLLMQNITYTNSSGVTSKGVVNVIGQEIKTLKLSDEKTILSAQLIAKAIKMNDVDRLLIVCEKEIPNLGTCKDDVVYYLSGYFGKVSDVQKAKWKEIQDANQ